MTVLAPGLVFRTARAQQAAHPNRMDVALFAGAVARRAGALPADVRTALRTASWIDGAWARPAAAIEALLQVPVVVESWDAFDRLYAWDRRLVAIGSEARCASTLGAAVRSFFAGGGRRAVIVRTGDPAPYVEDAVTRAAQRAARLLALGIGGALPFDPNTPQGWRGLQHLYGLGEVSLLCLPDLPELHATADVAPPLIAPPVPPSPEVFVECSADEPPLPQDRGLAGLAPPRLDETGFGDWLKAIGTLRDFLAARRRDVMFVGALPLADDKALANGIYANADVAAFLTQLSGYASTTSAFVQLATPWLRTQRSGDLPGDLEPGDGTLASAIAAKALATGTFRSVAGTMLPEIIETLPPASWGLGDDSPAVRLAAICCLVAPDPSGGYRLQSDVTTSRDPGWQPGHCSRLMDAVLRAAQRTGETLVFESSGPVLWSRLRRALEDTLTGFWQAGGLGGATPAEAFEVRCDRSTMNQNDIDNGRLVVRITVLPVAAIERITVLLDLGAAGIPGSLGEVA